ncbi:E3 ubiquitin-protein ligase TRIM68-like isoform X2 [Mugil cephalus]|nr:E3 ubiquitin-protein ligase TRIM68-like isoform X2 [Mugil cephalus]
MASSTSQQSSFNCCICLDDFTEPVSTPCGHNFCKICIYTYWESTNIIQCPICQQEFKKGLQLNVNILLRDLIEEKQSKTQKASEETNQTQDILCDLCAGEKKVIATKSCLDCEQSFCCEHVKSHHDDAELKTHELLDPVSRLKDRVCKSHKKLLELVCREDLTCVCVLCIKSNHQNHLCVPLKSRLRRKKSKVDQELDEVLNEIKDRKKMLVTVEGSGEIGKKNVRTDIADVRRIFNQLKSVLQTGESGLVTALALLQRKTEKRREDMKEKLQEEIISLEERKEELDHLSKIGDDLRFLQTWHSLSDPPVTKDWSGISVYSDSAVGSVRSGFIRLLSELRNKMNDERKTLVSKEIKRIQQYAVDVTLDPDTANNLLVVSDDGKELRNEGFPQTLADNPERFDTLLGVLGKEGYSSGAFYFEVQVEGKVAWDIGVALETVDRKGQTDVCLRNGYAVLMLRDGKNFKACDRPPVEIVLSQTPRKVGVFVDYEEGEVCFYDVGNEAHIYSFTRCRFPNGKLLPYFNTCTHHEENNGPMVITPVS